jgi:hypothetical protein
VFFEAGAFVRGQPAIGSLIEVERLDLFCVIFSLCIVSASQAQYPVPSPDERRDALWNNSETFPGAVGHAIELQAGQVQIRQMRSLFSVM